MTQDEHITHSAIRATLAICTQAGDARKAETYANTFTLQGVLDLGERIEGRAAIHRWMSAPSVILAPQNTLHGFVSHHLTTCRIDLTSDSTAKVRTYWLVITATGLDHSGYYDDRFCKVGDDWLIDYRRPRTLWIAPGSLIASG